MPEVDIKGLTPAQNTESDAAFVEVLGPIPLDDKGDPLFTPREFRDHCIYGYFKIIISQSRDVIEAKTETPHSTEVETEYGKIATGP